MHIRPFLLDRWLNEHQFATPPIEFDLAASTGPRWTWRDLTTTLAPDALERLLDETVSYGPATGSWALREAVAEMAGVAPDEVIIVTGASEALWILFLTTAQPGGNVVLPHPGFPTFDEVPRFLGLEVRHYHLEAASQHAIDLDEVAGLIDEQTALMLVNTPHNPTGAVVSDALLQAAQRPRGRTADAVGGRRGVSPHLPRSGPVVGGATPRRHDGGGSVQGAVPQRTADRLDHRPRRRSPGAVRGRQVVPHHLQCTDQRGLRRRSLCAPATRSSLGPVPSPRGTSASSMRSSRSTPTTWLGCAQREG